MRDWAKMVVQPQIRAARDVLAKATEYGRAKRANLAGPKADPQDLVGALLRQEIRALWRAMPIAERVAKLQVGGLPPVVALALVEAPVELSGITAEQQSMLIETAALAGDPVLAEELGDLAEAQQSVESAIRAVEVALDKDAGIHGTALDEVFDRPTYPERLAEVVGTLPSDERLAARKRMQTPAGRRAHFTEKFGLDESSGEDIASA